MESWQPLRRQHRRQRSVASLLVSCVAVLCLSCLDGGRADESQPPLVRIENGLISGKRITVVGKQVDAFLGIPYAVPPIGNLRFEKPQPADAWDGTLQAVNKPPPCRQLDMPFLAGKRLHYSNTSTEDCLYVNVWRPSSSCPRSESCGAKLAVIVFIHGGALQWGDSGLFLNDPSVFVAESNVVFVTFNYRVSMFGFLSAKNPDLPGNMGMWDQILLLKWVQKNIGKFGGDPAMVTLKGQSAGAITAGLLATSQQSKGLFNRIVMESSTPLSLFLTMSFNVVGQFVNVANAHGCIDNSKDWREETPTIVNCLRKVESDVIIAKLKEETTFKQVFPMVHGDQFFPNDPLDPETYADLHVKEILLGTTTDEGTVFLNSIRDVAPQFEDYISGNYRLAMTLALKTMFNIPLSHARDITIAYFGDQSVEHNKKSVIDIFCELFADATIYCPTLMFADVATQRGVKAYRYIFAHKASDSYWPEWMGVTHGDDLPYTMGALLLPKDENLFTPPVGQELRDLILKKTHTPAEEEFVKQIIASWAAFAKHGTPAMVTPGDKWPVHTAGNSLLVSLKPSSFNVTAEQHRSRCNLWKPLLLRKSASHSSSDPASQKTTTGKPSVKTSKGKFSPDKTNSVLKKPPSSSTVNVQSSLITVALACLTIYQW
ncbi:acetylcholinesterase-1-like [Dermacentor albipictus]|uniref:acetylcholinesterase-1-like n=1 Tax=Dermacentor albipictus TaxID=60249 RepID=UPI0031FBD23B